MREYIARDPRTGLPLSSRGGRSRIEVDEAYRPSRGPWDAIKHFDILSLANGEKSALEVDWLDRPHLVSQADGIKALPRIAKGNPEAAHDSLCSSLSELKPELRIAGLFSLPFIALTNPENLFEHLEELLDDVDTSVRVAASDCLKIVAPVFPSATEEILSRELRSEISSRNAAAFAALKEMCKVWPSVVVIHLDELLRLDDRLLRAKAAALLPPLARTKSAAVWDLIGWSLQDEYDDVRVQAARTLPTLASKAPSIARVLLEIAMFDESDKVRRQGLRAFNSMDMTGYRMNKLCIEGARHSDPEIRRACIKMIPKLFLESEMRIQAVELLRQETDVKLIALLEEMAIDPEIEGGEAEKNKFLAPAEPVTLEDGTVLPASAFDIDETGQPFYLSTKPTESSNQLGSGKDQASSPSTQPAFATPTRPDGKSIPKQTKRGPDGQHEVQPPTDSDRKFNLGTGLSVDELGEIEFDPARDDYDDDEEEDF
uniref:HEAT repeat domain-containing protein n=1 Tax=uncultured marine group II/III euryarchaeote KM3_31_G10 TaxID=1456433 RepID=A0A075H2E3_9EURY|nr:hypothetical protein [uncultured marine group II/III euryarchaeote KM3_31_G10]